MAPREMTLSRDGETAESGTQVNTVLNSYFAVSKIIQVCRSDIGTPGVRKHYSLFEAASV
jgi:hypothetical protein